MINKKNLTILAGLLILTTILMVLLPVWWWALVGMSEAV